MDALELLPCRRHRGVDGEVVRQAGKDGDQPVMAFRMPLAVMACEYVTGDC